MLICLFMQSEEVLITDLHSSMIRLIRRMMAFYIPMQTIKGSADITQIEHRDRAIQCNNIELNCGTKARMLITLLEETESSDDIHKLFRQCDISVVLNIIVINFSLVQMSNYLYTSS